MSYEDEREFDDYEWEIEQGLIEDPNGASEEIEEDELESYGIDGVTINTHLHELIPVIKDMGVELDIKQIMSDT